MIIADVIMLGYKFDYLTIIVIVSVKIVVLNIYIYINFFLDDR